MAEVKFRGEKLIDDAEGVWLFAPGMMLRNWVFVQPPRGIGELAKDMGLAGCDHTLSVTFLNVDEANIDNIFDRMQDFWTPSSGSPPSGTLEVPKYGSYRHCVITDCQPGEQSVRAKSVSPSSPKGTECWDLRFDITFRQLRR